MFVCRLPCFALFFRRQQRTPDRSLLCSTRFNTDGKTSTCASSSTVSGFFNRARLSLHVPIPTNRQCNWPCGKKFTPRRVFLARRQIFKNEKIEVKPSSGDLKLLKNLFLLASKPLHKTERVDCSPHRGAPRYTRQHSSRYTRNLCQHLSGKDTPPRAPGWIVKQQLNILNFPSQRSSRRRLDS